MKLAIMQPYFFPYIGYFQAINAVDKYILYDNLNFIKDGWMNRNRFLLKNGDPCYFRVALKEKSSFKRIYEIELIDDKRWKKKMLGSVAHNYKKAEYFEEVYDLIEKVINYPTNKLTELNYQSIKHVCDYLRIKTVISTDREKYNDLETKLGADIISEKDFPYLKIADCERKVIRILEICRLENADMFINAIGGMDLYSKDVFLKNGIELNFIKTKIIKYKQFNNDFVPDLSIIDVMMFNSKEKIKELLNHYELI
jgi:hypothetical protein